MQRTLLTLTVSICLLGCTGESAETTLDGGIADSICLLGCTGESAETTLDGGIADATSTEDADAEADAAVPAPDASSEFVIPRLGVYTVKTDGSELALLTDTGTRAYTHVRSNPDNDWLTATRYNNDLDGNGLAMEGEEVGDGSPHYGGTEIILFRSSSPNDVFSVSADGLVCDTPSAICANSSWTSDGKLILLNSHDGSGSNDWIKRVTFTTVPEAASVESLLLPPQLFAPVDPHQYGDSATGVIVFSALFNQGTPPEQKWMRPLWKIPAAGAATFVTGQTEFVGCSTCVSEGGACCSETEPELVVAGTNDARISHDGQSVLWMQSSREVTGDILGVTLNPYRQFIKPLVGGMQAALEDSLADDTTTHAYGEWSPDDAQIAYWELWVSGNSMPTFRVREELFVADVDGINRQPVPLPEELCAAHPSYLDQDTLVFTGWKCGGENCSCHPAAL
jgi:hypothetical protein